MVQAEVGHRPPELAPIKELTSPQVIIIIGGEGNGKTTQGELLAQYMSVPFFSTGKAMREIRDNLEDQSKMALEVRKRLKDRRYVRPSTLAQVSSQTLMRMDVSEGVVIDGMLRTVGETQMLPNLLREIGLENAQVNVVFLRSPGWLGVDRISKRNRDTNDSPLDAIARLSEFNNSLGKRMKWARRIAASKNGRLIIIDAKGEGEIEKRKRGEFSDEDARNSIIEVQQRIRSEIGQEVGRTLNG